MNELGSPLKCNACGAEADAVVASMYYGPISLAMCAKCLNAEIVPWNILVARLYGVTKDSVAEWIQPAIEATCNFYEKTAAQLWDEVSRLEKEFDDYCQRMDEDGTDSL